MVVAVDINDGNLFGFVVVVIDCGAVVADVDDDTDDGDDDGDEVDLLSLQFSVMLVVLDGKRNSSDLPVIRCNVK